MKSVFVSDDERVRTALEEYFLEQARYRAEIRKLLDEFPGYEALETNLGCQKRISGLRGTDAPGRDWRRYGEADWYPKRSTKGGRVMVSRLESIQLNMPDLPGMPVEIFHDGHMYYHGVGLFQDRIWVTWGCVPELVEAQQSVAHENCEPLYAEKPFDPSIWQRARMSEFWTAVEAAEAARKEEQTQ